MTKVCSIVTVYCILLQIIHAFDLCTEIDKISVKCTASVYGKSVYQKMANEYSLNRNFYGIYENYAFTQYNNHEDWLAQINETNDNAVDFAIIDTDLTQDDRTSLPSYSAIPIGFGKFLFIYNLPNVTNVSLSIDVIVAIMLQKVTFWNDSAIQNLNPFLELPEAKIQLFACSGNTVQNFYLSYFLSHYSKAWRAAFGDNTFYTLPTNNFSKWYNFAAAQSIVSSVSNNPYSFSYTTWSFLYNTKLANVKLAKIVDAKMDDVISSWPTFAKYIWNDLPISGDPFDAKLGVSEPWALYPFTYFQNAIVKMVDNKPKTSCCVIQEILGFIDFIFDYKVDLSTMGGFFPMPNKAIQTMKSSVLPSVSCQNVKSFEEFKKYETLVDIAERRRLIMLGVPSSVGSILLITIIVLIAYYRRMQLIREKFWIIGIKEIKVDNTIDKNIGKSLRSIQTGASEHTLTATSVSYGIIQQKQKRNGQTGFYAARNKHVTIANLRDVKSPNSWKSATKMVVANFCKNIVHINVSLLHGIWHDEEGKLYAVSEMCEKGSLSYVLATCPYTLSTDIKYSLAHDVIRGLDYLHKKGIVHGSLNCFNCDVDALWTVKLSNWSCNSICNLEGVLHAENTDVNEIEDVIEIIKIFYMDPEITKPALPVFASDVYSYGMILVEIFNQQTPFFEEVELDIKSYQDLLKNKRKGLRDIPMMSEINVPNDLRNDIPMMSEINVPNDLRNVVVQLVASQSNVRIDSTAVLNLIQKHRGKGSKNIVDIVMKSLESYVAHLEEKVTERTVELTSMTNRMKDLLNQLLPPQIAMQFINGEAVLPEFYECATIVFSDIVGFTTISARSTPIQVMAFLNELWKEFDSVAETFDVYKVDTIGDAYMVASGLPTRNGVHHCKHSADLSLALLRLTNTFRIPHLEGEQLKIRLGINSGPVTAGIVGFKMPQYCVFGDTVNTASRMESTSLPFKIQVSEQFHSLATSYFPSYKFDYRGETQIKGKGVMKTYWLLGKKEREISRIV